MCVCAYDGDSMASSLIYRNRPFSFCCEYVEWSEWKGFPPLLHVLACRNHHLFPRRCCDNDSGGSEEMALGYFFDVFSLLLLEANSSLFWLLCVTPRGQVCSACKYRYCIPCNKMCVRWRTWTYFCNKTTTVHAVWLIFDIFIACDWLEINLIWTRC